MKITELRKHRKNFLYALYIVIGIWIAVGTVTVYIQLQDYSEGYNNLILLLSGLVLSFFTSFILISYEKLRQRLFKHQIFLEGEVNQKTKLLLQKEKLAGIGELAARIAHDIRNPLSILQNSFEIMHLKHPNLVDSVDHVRITKSINRISHQIDDVLVHVREANMKFEKEIINELILKTIEKITIPKTVDLKISGKYVVIECDEVKLEAVFNNLILNALEAIDYKGKILIRVTEKNRQVVIEVEDSGHELDPEILDRMFEPLFTTKQRGTGLGLVSCKKIIESHHGKISVKSNPTIFTITLPIEQSVRAKVELQNQNQ